MRNKFTIILLLQILPVVVWAQDIHFSDFYSSPLNLNSATTGEFVGNKRFQANYRWQYGTVTVPYQTVSMAVDVKNNASKRKALPIGYGVLFNYDFTGDSKYTSFQFGIPLAYHYLFRSKKTRFSFGILPQIVFNQIDVANLQFPDQFITDKFYQSIKTKEMVPQNSLKYFNLSSGINTTYLLTKKSTLNVGFNIANLTKPSVSFLKNGGSVVNRKYSIMSRYRYRITPTIDFVPSTLFQFQGTLREFQYGAIAIQYLNNMNIPSMHYGAWYRSRENDAFILHFGLNIHGYLLGFNYDINLSKLSTASNGVGAFEISLEYIYNRSLIPHKFEAMKCPTHL